MSRNAGHSTMAKGALALALLKQGPNQVYGEIFPYDGMTLPYPRLIYRESGMFAPGRLFLEPGAEGGNGESFIRLEELKFRVEGTGWCQYPRSNACKPKTGHVDLAIFEQKSFRDVGVIVDKTRYYCCDEAARSVGACTSADDDGLLVTDDVNVSWQRRLEVLPGMSASLTDGDVFHVIQTGMYVVLVANCDSKNGDIQIGGHSEWMNPYGYLPGEAYGCLPFFFFLAVTYLALGVVWMVLCVRYVKDLLAVQSWASVVLLLGMVETGAQYFDYRDWNLQGTRSRGAQSFSILFGAAKRSLSLSLILMVCMGYGVVRPSLGRDGHRIMTMALVYFVTSALWVAVNNSSRGDREFTGRAGADATAVLAFFNSVIMVVFYGWILQSIIGVMQHLRLRRQNAKLQLYARFRMVLGASVLFSLAWSVYGIVQSSEDETVRHWKSYWTLSAIWELLYLAILMAVCYLLRPSMNRQRFAFSEVRESGDARDGNDGDILLQAMSDDAEYGGYIDGDEDKADEFTVPSSVTKKSKY